MMLFPLLGLGFSLTCCVGGLTLTGGLATTASPPVSSLFSRLSSTTSLASTLSWSPGEVSTLAGLMGSRSVCLSAGVGGALEALGGGSPATRDEAGMAISFPSEV